MEKIKLFEMFSGYGGASFALKKAGIDFECVGYSEIDKYAVQCWEQNHKTTTKNWGDCTKINPEDLPDFDLLTGGFPCQAFSSAGKQHGETDARGTLFNEIIRIAEVKKPKYMLLENVKGLTTKKFKTTYNKILSELDRIGYDVVDQVYKSKDYGTPQKRERVYFICHRKDLNFRYEHPQKTIEVPFKDVMEDAVDEKYFLSEVAKLGKTKSNYQDRKPFDIESQIPTLKIGGDVKNFKLSWDGWRKITPKEAFRCMGFFNDEINLEGLSDTQKYKLAGNGWDINLVSKIFKEMFKGNENGKN